METITDTVESGAETATESRNTEAARIAELSEYSYEK
jgi:hypothetical protein